MSDSKTQFAVGQRVRFETRGRGVARTLEGTVAGAANSPARIRVTTAEGEFSPFRSLTTAI